MALKVSRLYLKSIQWVKPMEFFKVGCDMTHFIQFVNIAAEGI